MEIALIANESVYALYRRATKVNTTVVTQNRSEKPHFEFKPICKKFEMNSKHTLWGMETSPPVRALLLTLKALNVDYEFKVVNKFVGEQLAPEYIEKNPQHTVPLLEDDGKRIWDSHAIIAYLASKYGKCGELYPKDYYQSAVVDQPLHYENQILFTTCLVGSLGPLIKGLAKAEIAAKINYICKQYDLMEVFLGDHHYMVGNNLIIADLSMVSTVSSLDALAPIDPRKNSKLAAWLERMKQLPYYEEANGQGVKAISELVRPQLAALN